MTNPCAPVWHLLPSSPFSCSKPVTWAPRSSYRGPSRDPKRWCWTWRWSPSTMSSTSAAAPSSAWRCSCRSIRSEWTLWPLWESNSSWCNSLIQIAHHPLKNTITMSSSFKDSAKNRWWEIIPGLESPPWFNGHWAFTAAIRTIDTEGYLWCTISDILF